MKRLPAITSFLLFVLLCASIAYWILQFWRPVTRQMAAAPVVDAAPLPLEPALALFGGRPTPVSVASNFQLRGVIVDANGVASVAIVATDGKPAKAVRLRSQLEPGVTVEDVQPRYIRVSDNGVTKQVDLPEKTSLSQSMGASPMSVAPMPVPGSMSSAMPTSVSAPAAGQYGTPASQ